MPERFKRYFLRAREAEALLRETSEKLGVSVEQLFETKVNVEIIETEFAEIYLINGKPLLAKNLGGNVFPTLLFGQFIALAPRVVIDMGAVPHVCNGANVMAPGIVRFEGEFRQGEFVLVVDEKHGKPVAVGEILYDVSEARKVSQGIVVRNVHFVSDNVWDLVKNVKAES